jgi:hypothetical protein
MLYKTIFWMNFLLLSPGSIFLPGHWRGPVETKKWVVSENSTLCVNGTTNVNKFACEILAYGQTDTLTITKGKNDKDITLSGNIGLHVESFDCHNSIMTHDLRKTLKEKQFPLLHINFLSLSKIPELTAQPEAITGMVDIEIAGTRKRFEVKYRIYVDAQKVVHLLGSRDINFTEFNLIPPRKLGGIIQTKDKLSVDFHLKMKALN